jgi:hypothetical protein
MQIISFDIGIKNMAYCILAVDSSLNDSFSIVDWNVINLLEVGNTKVIVMAKCGFSLKKKKGITPICGKTATFRSPTNEETCFCPRHAKMQSEYWIPVAEFSQASIKKLKINDLRTFSTKYGIISEDEMSNLTKPILLEKVLEYVRLRRLIPIVKPKVKNANQTDLVQIGKQIKASFSEISAIPQTTHILIENQISTIANRMKTIQGMVAQYFIMVLENPHVEFISSSNKLKNYVAPAEYAPLENTFYSVADSDDEVEADTGPLDKKRYRQHKSDGVRYCLDILKKYNMQEWGEKVVSHKKKDDLADCFLQGYWYIQKRSECNLLKS